ncbi:hypothetical protein BS17DRAFT_822594 [Gyrodon lividus]|nr:hypothetical protein BS17DRAFT_822594 [Gyrodon lividus]
MVLEQMYSRDRSSSRAPPHSPDTVAHDLESFFYVLLVICILFEHPSSQHPMEELQHSSLKDWWMPSNYHVAADWKVQTFTNGLLPFKQHITSNFTSYFQPMIVPITNLFDTVFRGMEVEDPRKKVDAFSFQVSNKNPVTYKVMLEKMESIFVATVAANRVCGRNSHYQ